MEPPTDHPPYAGDPGGDAATGQNPLVQILKAVMVKRVEDALREQRALAPPPSPEPVPPAELQIRVARLFDLDAATTDGGDGRPSDGVSPAGSAAEPPASVPAVYVRS